jgi:SAM-dependent methyltransferase
LAEFTGERVIPGQVDPDLLNEHRARYVFASRLAQGKRVLDAGCGVGFGSAELAAVAAEVLGVDRSAEAIEYAREHYAAPNLEFKEGDCAALPVNDAAFDLVVAFEVIEHLEDWRGFLAEARRALAPGGRFLVSTPNRSYYSESRRAAGPNPFHVHEFDYEEFQAELRMAFPHVAMYAENHADCVVFQPAAAEGGAGVQVEGACDPAESHFFVALCALDSQPSVPGFVWVPSAANVLREREKHIELLERELAAKNEWLEKAKNDLAQLNADHQSLLTMFRAVNADLEKVNQWAEHLKQEFQEQADQLLAALAHEQAEARKIAEGYAAKVSELEQDVETKVGWAREIEGRLNQTGDELKRCIEMLDAAEKTVIERTLWAQGLNQRLSLVEGSRWVRLGRKLGLGPATQS